jgi:hypothetical protein
MKVAGITLETPCFSPGQMYVACSRVGTGKQLYVFAPDAKTKNVVYRIALQKHHFSMSHVILKFAGQHRVPQLVSI